MITKIFMVGFRGWRWPTAGVHLAGLGPVDHFHFRFGGPAPYSSPPSWPGGGYGTFIAPPMELSTVQQNITRELLSPEPFYVVTHSGPRDDFWREYFKGILYCAKRRDIPVRIQYPKLYGDYSKQLALLNEIIDKKPVGIVTWLPHKSFLPALRKAHEDGIPIMVVKSRSSKFEPVKNPHPEIGLDDYKIGQLVGIRAMKTFKNQRKAVVVTNLNGPSAIEFRLEGIRSILEKEKIPVDLLTLNLNDRAGGAIFQKYIKDNPDLTTVIALRGSVLDVLRDQLTFYKRRKNKRLYCASFGRTHTTMELLKQGYVDFYVDTRPFLQGYLSLITPLRNYRVKPKIITAPAAWTRVR